ncbi:N6-adenine-specific DNA methyltransferase, D12 family [Sulfurimonas gotlandica GD1]|uniref:site-specific DNA-methyltransferase (adenine-specific) n=1 Tax=Sulfurimonas gotlandica (strain DSM 19862 / JCM 16533 / GD1) TaxID=929558 RepID=B6BHV0_SULGG|nr:DNA adenine methylase [Sulfurimonas gotlandica]EDZ63186.1 modification methylase StsI [Sulfurimonas gotlandica GD1]EHP30101.1 N6-adenine-specific DNA methyltransferase, D12 family [Sulfurimonas gotlandica GD1]
MYKISQRRYLGNKNRILDFIAEIIKEEVGNFNSLCDIFSGTGVVGEYFNTKNKKIISNDLLYNNYVSLNAFLNPEPFNEVKLLKIIDDFNKLDVDESNYFSDNFGDRYFSMKVAKKIGYIRENIRDQFVNNFISQKEKNILLTSLMYSVDRIANTVGHYDAYIKKDIKKQELVMKMLEIYNDKNSKNEVHNKDANLLVRDIECDVLYLDPPYNSRQYCDAYHLLENLSLWNKPEVFGVAKKFDRTKIKSDYSKISAAESFDDLIQNAKCKYILLSYNNMGEKGNSRSNAKISDEDIIKSMSKRGEVKIFEKDYKAFTTGKSKHSDNKERVFFVKVKV